MIKNHQPSYTCQQMSTNQAVFGANKSTKGNPLDGFQLGATQFWGQELYSTTTTSFFFSKRFL